MSRHICFALPIESQPKHWGRSHYYAVVEIGGRQHAGQIHSDLLGEIVGSCVRDTVHLQSARQQCLDLLGSDEPRFLKLPNAASPFKEFTKQTRWKNILR